MLGLVFSEFMDMVETSFPDDVFDRLIDVAEESCDSGGEYTAVGKYDHVEMLTLVTALSEKTEIPVGDLVHAYGKHLFGRFHKKYPEFFEDDMDAFQFLKRIEDKIHVQVRRLYPQAELPKFTYEEPSEKELILHYQSNRPFAALAHGLIEGCIAYFDEKIDVEVADQSEGSGTKARFHLTRRQ